MSVSRYIRPRSIAVAVVAAVVTFLASTVFLVLGANTPAFAAVNYVASAGFSSTQGQNQWFYQKLSGGSYSNLATYTASPTPRWQEASGLPYVRPDFQHPETTYDAVRKWVSPGAGTVDITGGAKLQNLSGDGVKASISKNSTQLWTQTFNSTSLQHPSGVTGISVAAGDAIYFIVNKNGTASFDETYWNPTIAYTAGSPSPSPSTSPSASPSPSPTPSTSPTPPAGRGATVPWTTYEAESGAHNGTVNSTLQLGAEASGGKSVRLDAAGESIQFTNVVAANRLVLRYNIPQGTSGTLSLYVNGSSVTDMSLVSNRIYSNFERNGPKVHRFFDEKDIVVNVPSGATVKLQKDSDNSLAFYNIDLMDLEMAPAALAMPANFKSVTDCGANGSDTVDDLSAINSCMSQANSAGQGLWFPSGTFYQSAYITVPAGMTVKGAGMWHTKLFGYNSASSAFLAGFTVNSNTTVNDLRISTANNYRSGSWRPAIDLPYPAGANNFTVQRVWIEYTMSGLAIFYGTNGTIKDSRVRLTYADALHADFGAVGILFQNNHIRGQGDDGIATVSTNNTGQPIARNITARFNTIVANYFGRGMAAVGGNNILYEDNIITDIAYFAGLIVETVSGFPTHGMDGVTYRRNTVERTGTESYLNSGHSQVLTNITRSGTQALNVHIENNDINNCHTVNKGVWTTGNQKQTTWIQNNTLRSCGSSPIANTAGGAGTVVTISGNTIIP